MGCVGWCGIMLRCLVYVAVPLAAVLVYFHLECVREKDEAMRTKFHDEYHPDTTDCQAELPFATGDSFTYKLGPEFMLMQWIPCSLSKLITFISLAIGTTTKLEDAKKENQMINISILDARKHSHGEFHESGFTLITLDEETKTQNWRANSEDIHLFQEQMEPYLKKMYPQTKRITWYSHLIRGDTKPGDQPRALGPHLDYHQSDELREEFYKVHDTPGKYMDQMNKTEPHALIGDHDTEDEKLGVMLGIWKPLYPSEVCDYPLAVMDASTFYENNQIIYNLHINFIFAVFNNLNGAISYNPEQKWYYYSKQNTKEVLVFHQYSKGKFFANPHTSFLNKNCPKGTESEERISAELRVGLFF